MARKNSIISADVNDLTITFNVEGVDSFDIDVSTLSEDVCQQALIHGIRQKISDAAAMPKDSGATPADKFEAMKAVAMRLVEGDWKASRGDGSGPVAGIIYRAFAQWANEQAKARKTDAPAPETIRAKYDSLDRAGKLALRKIPRIAEIMDEMRIATAPSMDVDTLLSDLF